MPEATNQFDNATGLTLEQSEVAAGVLRNAEIVAGQFQAIGRTTSGDVLSGLDVESVSSLDGVIASKPAGSTIRIQVSSDGVTFTNAFGEDCTNTGAFTLDGVNDYLGIDAPFRTADQSGAVSMWVRYTPGGGSWIWMNGAWTNNGNRVETWIVGAAGSRSIDLRVTNSTTINIGNRVRTPPGSIVAGRWHHVIWISTGSSYVILIDGVLQPLSVISGSNNGSWFSDCVNLDRWTIGAQRKNFKTQFYFGGDIDDVRVFSQAPTTEQAKDFFFRHKTPPGQVNRWRFDEIDTPAVGQTPDAVGTAHLTIVGAQHETDWRELPVFGEAVGTLDTLALDGVNDYVDISHSSLNIVGDLTVSAWINPRRFPTSGHAMAVNQWSASTGTNFYIAFLETFGWDLCVRSGNGGSGGSTILHTPIPLNAWTHVVLRREGTTLTLFVDGQLIDSTDITGFLGGSASATWIGRFSSGTYHFDGLLANVSVWASGLSDSQVQTLSSQGHRGGLPTPLGEWRADEGAGTILNNHGTASNQGSIVGATWTQRIDRPAPSAESWSIDVSGAGLTNSAFWRVLMMAVADDRTAALDELSVVCETSVGLPLSVLVSGHYAGAV